MSADLLRRAAEKLRSANAPYFDSTCRRALADLLQGLSWFSLATVDAGDLLAAERLARAVLREPDPGRET